MIIAIAVSIVVGGMLVIGGILYGIRSYNKWKYKNEISGFFNGNVDRPYSEYNEDFDIFDDETLRSDQ